MGEGIRTILKSPIVDIWSSIFEAGVVFVIKMGSRKESSLGGMMRSLLHIPYKSLLLDFLLTGLPFAMSILFVFYVAMQSIRCFNIFSYVLVAGSSVHLAVGIVDPSLGEYLHYMLLAGMVVFLFVLYYVEPEDENHPFLDIADVIRDHPRSAVFILCASVVKAFLFVWFFSGANHGGMGCIKTSILAFFEMAAMSSLMYNLRTGIVLLMTVDRSTDVRAYARLMLRRARLIGTICLAGIFRPIMFAVCVVWSVLELFGAVQPLRERYTLRRGEISLFYSILNDVSLFEGRRIAEEEHRDKMAGQSVDFRLIPGLFIPCCFSSVYILSSSVGRYTQYLPQTSIYLYFVLLYLMFLEFLYSVITVRSITRQKDQEDLQICP